MSFNLSRESRIGYCLFSDPEDKTVWSGTQYYIYQALKDNFNNVIPIRPRLSISRQINTDFYENHRFSEKVSPLIDHELRENKCDVFIVPSNFLPIFLKSNVPVVLILDGAFSRDMNFLLYSFRTKVRQYLKYRNLINRKILQKIDKFFFASEWGCQALIDDKKFDKSKLRILPFGANLEMKHDGDRIFSYRKKIKRVCRLLFVGKEWVRKGGQIAYDTMVELNRRGINTELIFCGVAPPNDVRHKKMRIVGLLNKNDKKQNRKLNHIYKHSDFLFVPSRAEAFGIVFCEAAAWGLPVISTETGGIPSVVKDQTTGYLLPLDAGFSQYADRIQDIWQNHDKYLDLCRNARKKYEAELNWDVWGKRFSEILMSA